LDPRLQPNYYDNISNTGSKNSSDTTNSNGQDKQRSSGINSSNSNTRAATTNTTTNNNKTNNNYSSSSSSKGNGVTRSECIDIQHSNGGSNLDDSRTNISSGSSSGAINAINVEGGEGGTSSSSSSSSSRYGAPKRRVSFPPASAYNVYNAYNVRGMAAAAASAAAVKVNSKVNSISNFVQAQKRRHTDWARSNSSRGSSQRGGMAPPNVVITRSKIKNQLAEMR